MVVTPHMQHKRGKVIGVGVYTMFVDQKKFLSDRLTFSNIRGRTSRQIIQTSSTTAFSRNAFLIV